MLNNQFNKETIKEVSEIIQEEAQRFVEDRERLKEAERNRDPKEKRKESITIIFFILLFTGVIFSLAIFANTKPILCAPVFGVLFLVFGSMAVKQHKLSFENLYLLIFPLVGLALIVIPIMEMQHVKNTGETMFTKRVLVYFMGSVFCFVGTLFVVTTPLKNHFMMKKCSEPVIARCTFLKERVFYEDGKRKVIYAPKWEYTIRGKVYEYQEEEYSNIDLPRLDEERLIYVNPEALEQAYRRSPKSMIFFICMGLFCIAGGLAFFYAEHLG